MREGGGECRIVSDNDVGLREIVGGGGRGRGGFFGDGESHGYHGYHGSLSRENPSWATIMARISLALIAIDTALTH